MSAPRRQRVLDAMAAAGLDAVVLGREANARYVSGARRLWLAGARAFAPSCVLTSGGDVHLLSASDDGVPADIPFAHLYPITWNPSKLTARLATIPGLARAHTIGVDALTPTMSTLLSLTFPSADLADAQALLLAARRVKSAEEVDTMRAAVAIAAAALDDVIAAAVPGARECDLLGRFAQQACERGTTTPAFEGRFGSVFPSDRALVAGERVVFDVGVLVDGYEGGLARTIVCGDGGGVVAPADAAFEEVLARVGPGVPCADVARFADGVGLGAEPLSVAGGDDVLVEGMTLSVRVEVEEWVRRDQVLVTARGAELLLGP